MAIRGIFRRIRTAGVFLALFALTFKAMLPPGYMITPAPNHIVVAMCGGGELSLNLDTGRIQDGHKRQPSKNGDEKQHCPFAHIGVPTVVSSQASASVPQAVLARAAAPFTPSLAPLPAYGPPLPARGPPLDA